MSKISDLILPAIVLFILAYGMIKKINIYDEFVEGAKDSYDMVLTMFPTMLAMMFGINIFIKSGFLDWIFSYFSHFFSFLKVPVEVIPLSIMRSISGSSSLAIYSNLLELYGPDSFISKLAAVIQGSTDTTFYILTLYFGSVGIKKIRYSLFAGLFADFIGFVSAIILCNIFF